MNLVKTTFLSFISTVIKLLSGLAINKVAAVYLGPAGVAIIGQFQNFSQLVMTLGQGAMNAGITKYTAEYGRDSEELPKFLATALRISFFCCLFVSIALISFSSFLSKEVFGAVNYGFVFVTFGFTIFLYVLNTLILSVLNGLKEVKELIKVQIIQSVYSLIFTCGFIYFLGLAGALIALVTNQSIIFLVVLYRLRKNGLIKLTYFKGQFDRIVASKLFKFSLMALVPALATPVSHFFIRDYIISNFGVDEAGYWQGMWYISSMYLMVITTALSTYYLPRLSEIKCNLKLKAELKEGVKLILPVVLCMSSGIFILKDFIIWLVFTNEFSPMRELFLWQLVGDVLKVTAWLFAYIFVAKALARQYIIIELAFLSLFIFLSIFSLNTFGLIGMTYAYAACYALYLIAVSFLVWRKFT